MGFITKGTAIMSVRIAPAVSTLYYFMIGNPFSTYTLLPTKIRYKELSELSNECYISFGCNDSKNNEGDSSEDHF
jgi:hypothetical protein